MSFYNLASSEWNIFRTDGRRWRWRAEKRGAGENGSRRNWGTTNRIICFVNRFLINPFKYAILFWWSEANIIFVRFEFYYYLLWYFGGWLNERRLSVENETSVRCQIQGFFGENLLVTHFPATSKAATASAWFWLTYLSLIFICYKSLSLPSL